jgi:alpha-L-rhamnosidase
LRWVKAAYHSLHGRIESEWQLEGDRFQLRVKIPPNTSATIQLPGQGVAGTPAGPFQAGSGEHVFQSRL